MLEGPAALYHLRLAPALVPPDSENYYDITIEPNQGRPSEEWELAAIWRNKDVARTVEFAGNFRKNLERLLSELEGGSQAKLKNG